jgi:hypothetical protein
MPASLDLPVLLAIFVLALVIFAPRGTSPRGR